jgi:hypothetical protein
LNLPLGGLGEAARSERLVEQCLAQKSRFRRLRSDPDHRDQSLSWTLRNPVIPSGRPVAGFGFHERTLPLSTPRQLVIVLYDSVRNLPTEALDDGPLTAAQLADLVWETMRLAESRRHIEARNCWVEETVRPALARLADSHRPHVEQIVDDLIRRMTPSA